MFEKFLCFLFGHNYPKTNGFISNCEDCKKLKVNNDALLGFLTDRAKLRAEQDKLYKNKSP
jgi:hypothetical protein